MPVLTKTKKTVKPSSRVEDREDEEVETKDEPKVVVDKGLAKLVTEWDTAFNKSESYWPRIAQYVAENDIKRVELKKALIDLRGMKELTANNEVSKIFKAIEHPDLLEQVVDGEMSVREFREKITKKQEGTDDPETKLKKSLRRLAIFAIQEVEVERADFIAEAKAAYNDSYAKLEAKAAKANEANGDEEEGDEEEEE